MRNTLFDSQRLHAIDVARDAVLRQGHTLQDVAALLGASWQERVWIEQSWRRCIDEGFEPHRRVDFDLVPHQARKRIEEENHSLLKAAQSPIQQLGQAIASTRYFVILTDAHGVVIGAEGAIDNSDPRANVIARVGVDLSERKVGTSAIGAALHEKKSVWLHRGEHFFMDTSAYSCAGAPLWSPQGQCVGMLDLTGIDAQERPDLVHVVVQSARSIENAMVQALPYALMVRVNWLGQVLGEASDGLLALDEDGRLLGFNQAAKQILSILGGPASVQNASDLFAIPIERMFDAARAGRPCFNIPLWSGLRVNVQSLRPHQGVQRYGAPAASTERLPLKDMEESLIKQAVQDSRGNVAEAAQKLGISRSTLYRKLTPASKIRTTGVQT